MNISRPELLKKISQKVPGLGLIQAIAFLTLLFSGTAYSDHWHFSSTNYPDIADDFATTPEGAIQFCKDIADFAYGKYGETYLHTDVEFIFYMNEGLVMKVG